MDHVDFSFKKLSQNQYLIDGKKVDVIDIKGEEQPLVSVTMITYNHEKYILQAVEGVLMQNTNFKIELIIGEDCSTDKTRDIVFKLHKQYPDKIILKLPELNLGVRVNSVSNKLLCKGKYIAECEGDDYWTDPYKLQKQIDILEEDPSISAVCTNAIFQTDQGIEGNFFELDDAQLIFLKFYEQYSKNQFPTLTGVFRKDLLLLNLYNSCTPLGDWAFVNYAMSFGPVVRLNDVTAVYRMHDGGIYSNKSDIDRALDYISTANYLLKSNVIRHANILNSVNKLKAFQVLKVLIRQYDFLKLIINSHIILKALIKKNKPLITNKNVNVIIADGSSVDIGNNVRFRHFCSIVAKNNGEITIGDNCFFNSYVSINCFGSIRIGNNSIFGEGVRIYDHNHKYGYNGEHRDYSEYKISSIEIGQNCWIGSNVVILAGVSIGNDVVVGAGCLIYKDIPSGKIVKAKQELIIK